jgi:HD-like signal output (HDOD) protein
MALWGIPDAVVECIRFHHTPLVMGSSRSLPLLSIHLADALLAPMTLAESMEHGLMDPEVLHHPLIEGKLESIQSALKAYFPGSPDMTGGLS